MDIMDTIKEQVEGNDVIFYMKGSPQFPQCGFSAQSVEAIQMAEVPFAYVNVLEAPEIRANLPKYANWPTFPQLWIKGELVGGCDIIMELSRSGELSTMLKSAVPAES